MKKIIVILTLIFTGLMFLAPLCPSEKNVEVPIVDSEGLPIQVDEQGTSYDEIHAYVPTDGVSQIQTDNDFIKLLDIRLQAVSYIITDDESPANTKIQDFVVEVSSTSETGPYQTLMEIPEVILDDVEGMEQKPELDAVGVHVINEALDVYVPEYDGTHGANYWFRVGGTATQSPIKFKITIKIYLTVLGLVKVSI